MIKKKAKPVKKRDLYPISEEKLVNSSQEDIDENDVPQVQPVIIPSQISSRVKFKNEQER